MWKEPIIETNVWARRSSLVGVPFVCWAVMVWVGEIVEKLAIMKLLENLLWILWSIHLVLNLICNRWYMTPQTVNAYYSPSRNQIGKFIPSVSCSEKTQSYSTACYYYYYYYYVHHWPSAFPLSSSSLSLTKTLALSKLSSWFTGEEWNGHQYSREV